MGFWSTFGRIAIGAGLIAASIFVPGLGAAAPFIFSVGASLSLSGATAALVKKPDDAPIKGLQIVTKESAAARRTVYGHAKVGGIITFQTPAEANNVNMLVLVTVTGHIIEGVTRVYFNNEALSMEAIDTRSAPTGGVDGVSLDQAAWPSAAETRALMQVSRGDDGQRGDVPYDSLITDSGGVWTAAHAQRGCGNVYLRLNYKKEDFPNGAPSISFALYGKPIYDPRSNPLLTVIGATNASPIVIETSSAHGLSLGDIVRLRDILGNTAANGEWFILQDIDSTHFSIDGGVGNGAYISGGSVFKLAWSDNAALCAADYLLTTKLRGGFGATYDEIDWPVLEDAADVCDEAVTVPLDSTVSPPTTTTERRYTINGVFEWGAPIDVLGKFAAAMAGIIIPISGKWVILPGKLRTATFTLTDKDIVAPISFDARRKTRDLYNAVKGTYISRADKYEETDFPPVLSDTYKSEDGGDRIFNDISLPFTTSPWAAQRLASIDLERNRRQISAEVVCTMAAYVVQPGSVIQWTHARLWTDKLFEVVNSTVAVEDMESGPSMVTRLSLVEVDAGVYADTDYVIPEPLPVFDPPDIPWTPTLFVDDDGCVAYYTIEGDLVVVACPEVYADIGLRFAVDESGFFGTFDKPAFRLQDSGSRIVYRIELSDIAETSISQPISYRFDTTGRYLAVLYRLADLNKYVARLYYLGESGLVGDPRSGEDEIYDLNAQVIETGYSDDIDTWTPELTNDTASGLWVDVFCTQDGKLYILEATEEIDSEAITHVYYKTRRIQGGIPGSTLIFEVPYNEVDSGFYWQSLHENSRIIKGDQSSIQLVRDTFPDTEGVDPYTADVLHSTLLTPIHHQNIVLDLQPYDVRIVNSQTGIMIHNRGRVDFDGNPIVGLKVVKLVGGQYVSLDSTNTKSDLMAESLYSVALYPPSLVLTSLGSAGSPGSDGYCCDGNGEVRLFGISGADFSVDPDGGEIITPQAGSPIVNELTSYIRLTLPSNPVDGKIYVMGDITYTFRDSVTTAYDVKKGASTSATASNLYKAITDTGSPGTDYGIGTVAHPDLIGVVQVSNFLRVRPSGEATTHIAFSHNIGSSTMIDMGRLPGGKGEEVWRQMPDDFGFCNMVTAFGVRAELQA